MPIRRMFRAFFRSIGWNVALGVAIAVVTGLVDAVTGGGFWVLLGVLFGAVVGVVVGAVHGVVQAMVALVPEPHRRTVACALAAGVSASLATWSVRSESTGLGMIAWYAPYVVASAFLARWCRPVDQRHPYRATASR